MNIVLIACERKRELLIRFCVSYRSVFCQHKIFTLSNISKILYENTKIFSVEYIGGEFGGIQQICSKISYDEIDLVIFFRDDTNVLENFQEDGEIIKVCDFHNVPLATNIATAEILIHGLVRGDLNWRNIGNPII